MSFTYNDKVTCCKCSTLIKLSDYLPGVESLIRRTQMCLECMTWMSVLTDQFPILESVQETHPIKQVKVAYHEGPYGMHYGIIIDSNESIKRYHFGLREFPICTYKGRILTDRVFVPFSRSRPDWVRTVPGYEFAALIGEPKSTQHLIVCPRCMKDAKKPGDIKLYSDEHASNIIIWCTHCGYTTWDTIRGLDEQVETKEVVTVQEKPKPGPEFPVWIHFHRFNEKPSIDDIRRIDDLKSPAIDIDGTEILDGSFYVKIENGEIIPSCLCTRLTVTSKEIREFELCLENRCYHRSFKGKSEQKPEPTQESSPNENIDQDFDGLS